MAHTITCRQTLISSQSLVLQKFTRPTGVSDLVDVIPGELAAAGGELSGSSCLTSCAGEVDICG